MKKTMLIKPVLLLMVLGLVACGGSDKKSSNPASSSSAASSSVANNVMELNKEYPYTDSTKITNTSTTALIVEKKHYWDGNKTVVILKEGSATIQ